VVAEHYEISRQAAARHLNDLVNEGAIEAHGATRQRTYRLRVFADRVVTIGLQGLQEDVVWREFVAGDLHRLPRNVVDMWQYGVTEMVNNAIDHSEGSTLTIELKSNAAVTNVAIFDDGVGIFRKIREAHRLDDERHAVLELAKGKLTTDPERHTGEGIFFTSRIMSHFEILSGDVYFSHTDREAEDWIIEVERPVRGTAVFMGLDNMSTKTTKEVFDHFAADPEDYGFTKTVVPVKLARQGAEQLISRSQAKRLLARLDRFRTVILDFDGVDTIGRAFADEIFRVFASANPGTLILHVNANADVERLIEVAKNVSSTGTAAT
jgi:anti-sigma regulatory factor (Ser/Thr protein kinase)